MPPRKRNFMWGENSSEGHSSSTVALENRKPVRTRKSTVIGDFGFPLDNWVKVTRCNVKTRC